LEATEEFNDGWERDNGDLIKEYPEVAKLFGSCWFGFQLHGLGSSDAVLVNESL
jgi:hypothetical protein